jgi:pimeloyl-ACP methyl ester carboxylesterase
MRGTSRAKRGVTQATRVARVRTTPVYVSLVASRQATTSHAYTKEVKMKATKPWLIILLLATLAAPFARVSKQSTAAPSTSGEVPQVHYQIAKVDGVDVFYRDAGPRNAPVLLLLHGFPTSSHMFRDLIPRLADKYRVIAPDYPGFGYSGAPDHTKFAYTFENYANIIDKLTRQIGVNRYALYVMDYGAPVGFRLAIKNPDRVTAFVVQNGNAYDEGIEKFWDPIRAYWKTHAQKERDGIHFLTTFKATYWQYTNGVKDTSLVSPDAWTVDQALLDRPGNPDVQLDLFYDYRTNLPLYPQWQAYFRERKPPMLIVWGQNDEIFVAAGAAPYKRDLPNAEIHMFDTGHFALETHGPEIAKLIREFFGRAVPTGHAS